MIIISITVLKWKYKAADMYKTVGTYKFKYYIESTVIFLFYILNGFQYLPGNQYTRNFAV